MASNALILRWAFFQAVGFFQVNPKKRFHIMQLSLVMRGHVTFPEESNEGEADVNVKWNAAVRNWKGC